jgi:ABC-type amino acid transport system permease subunit
MVALLIGIILVLFALFAGLPLAWGLDWWNDVLIVLRGGIPILAVFIGIIAVFIGIADIKDKIEAKREEEEEQQEDEDLSSQASTEEAGNEQNEQE